MKKNPSPEPPLPSPRVSIACRQRSVAYDRARLRAIVQVALPRCIAAAARFGGPLAGLREVEISVVGNRTMSALHVEYFDLGGPTDVITFPYGEIFVCAPVAAAIAPEFGNSATEELALYCIHGLLHLAGYDDARPADARRMKTAQEKILREALRDSSE